MAKPTDPIVVWAREDVNLPGTGKPNKVKPIDDLLNKGYDKGQKPAAEEFNYILNQSSGWVDWIVNEKFPELENEIARLLRELENRLQRQIDLIKQDITNIKQSITDLRKYVDEKVAELRTEIATVAQDLNKLRQDFDSAIQTVNNRIDNDILPRLVPIGAVLPWPGQVAPDGYLECNGQVFNTALNPKLTGVLGRNTVPDYRGLFLRGWAHGSGAFDPDYNRGIGSVQGDAMRPITGGTVSTSRWRALDGIFGAFRLEPRRWDTNYKNGGGDDWGDYISFDSSRVVPTAPEVRPSNVAVMYIIKTDQAETSGSNSPTGIIVSPDTITNRVGFTVRATAQVLPTSLAGQYPVTWTSQNPAVATVDGNGNVTLVGPGVTNVIASISTGMNSVIRVTSYSVLTSLSIGPYDPLPVGSSRMLQITKNPGDANEPMQYLSNNPDVATVNDSGYVSGISVGTATITVRGTLSGVSATRLVTITPEEEQQTLEDIEFGVVTIADFDSGYNQVPSGCTIVGGDWYTDGGNARLGYKPIMKKIAGQWVIISG